MRTNAVATAQGKMLVRRKPARESEAIWLTIPGSELFLAFAVHNNHQLDISVATRGAQTVTNTGTWRTLPKAIWAQKAIHRASTICLRRKQAPATTRPVNSRNSNCIMLSVRKDGDWNSSITFLIQADCRYSAT